MDCEVHTHVSQFPLLGGAGWPEEAGAGLLSPRWAPADLIPAGESQLWQHSLLRADLFENITLWSISQWLLPLPLLGTQRHFSPIFSMRA